MAEYDSTRQTLAEFRRRFPPVSRTVNNNFVIALPVMSLLDSSPPYWRCFVNGFELPARFSSAADLWDNAAYIEADYRRCDHVDPRFFMIPVLPDPAVTTSAQELHLEAAVHGGPR